METCWQHSAEKIEWNDEILTEILLRVPEKTLVRLKSVSKRWLSLISGPYFRSLYAKSSTRLTCALFLVPNSINRSDHLVTLRSHNNNVDPRGWLRDMRVLSSCNGLVLAIGLKTQSAGGKEDLIVCNPRLNRVCQLPDHSRSKELWAFSIAFDPLISSGYKVIALRFDNFSSFRLLHADTYTSPSSSRPPPVKKFAGEGEWKYVCDSIRVSIWGYSKYCRIRSNNYWDSTYWNGDVYWLAPCDNLLYFCIAQDRFGVTPRPPAPRGYHNLSDVLYEHLSESRGYLYLLQIYTMCEENSPLALYIYTMKSSRSEWSLMHHHSCFDVVLGRLPTEVKQRFSTLSSRGWLLRSIQWCNFILGLIHNGEDENELLLVLQIRGERGRTCPIICYNIKQQSSYTLLDHLQKNNFWRRAIQYVPSLAYPPSLTGRS